MKNLKFKLKRLYYHYLRKRDEHFYRRLKLARISSDNIKDIITFDKKQDYWSSEWD